MKKIKGIIFFIILIVFEFNISFYLFAQNKNNEVIRIGYIPFKNFVTKNEKNKGYGYEYLKEIEGIKKNIKFEMTSGTWEELLNDLANDKIDFIMLGHKTEERKEIFDFSTYSMGYSKAVLYSLSKNNFYYKDYKNFNEKKIGYYSETLGERFLNYSKENKFKPVLVKYYSYRQSEEALINGDIDLLISEIMEPLDYLEIVDSFDIFPFYVLAEKGSRKLKFFNEAQKKLYEKNPLFNINLIDKYYSKFSKETNQLTREEKEFLKANPEYTVGVSSQKTFLSSYDKKEDKYIGIQPDIIREISKRSGIKLKIRSIKKGENLKTTIEEKTNDMSIGLERDEGLTSNTRLHYAEKLIKIQWSFLYMKGKKIKIDGIKKIGVSKDFYSLHKFINKKRPDWNMIAYKSIEDSFKALQKGEVDFTIINNYDAQYYLQNPRYKNLKTYPIPIIESSMNLVMSSDINPLAKSILNKTILDIDESTFNSIITSNLIGTYYKLDLSTWIYAYRYYLIIIFIVLILLCFVFIFCTIKIHKKNKELDRANLAKSDFLARISHDMRTPLSAVIGLSNFGIEESKENHSKKYFQQIKDSSEYLLELLTDILDLQSLQIKNIFLKNKINRVGEISNKVEAVIRAKAVEKNIKLEIDVEELKEDYYAFFDSKRMEQILINLLNNAIKYTPSGGYVLWKTRFFIEGKKIVIVDEIKDNGVGISEKFQSKMFDAFSQERNKMSYESDGVGLGLSICKKIIDSIGGEITCKSKLGKGTTFKIKSNFDLLSEEEVKEEQDEKKFRLTIEKFKGKKILICEDIEINAKIIMKILDKYKLNYSWVDNGKKAIEIIENNLFHVILMDIRMPVMNGIEATEKIRKFNKEIPIIILSANAYSEDIKNYSKMGINDFIEKPIKVNELISSIYKVI